MKNKFHYVALPLFAVLAASASIPLNFATAEPTNKTSGFLDQVDPADEKLMILILKHRTINPNECLKHYGTRIEKNATAMRLLGQLYYRTGDIDNARKWLDRAIQRKHNDENLRALAEFQLAIGEEDGWLKTMNSRLRLPFDRHNFANTNYEIADQLISLGRWDEACPYAEASARGWNRKNLIEAAWINGVLGRTDRGAEYVEQCVSLDGTDYLSTYTLTFAAQPSEWGKELLINCRSKWSTGDSLQRARAAMVDLINMDYESAVSLLESSLERSSDPYYGLLAALICEEQEWFEKRDRILRETLSRYPKLPAPPPNRKALRRFIDLYISANESGSLSASQVQKLNLFAKQFPNEGFNVDAHAFAGELLRLKGNEDEAKVIFKNIISVRYRQRFGEFIPYRGLRAMGEDPLKILDDQRKQLVTSHADKNGESK